MVDSNDYTTPPDDQNLQSGQNLESRQVQTPFRLAQQATSGYDLKKLRENHHLILRLYATGKFTQKHIAKIVGCTEVTVNYTVNSDLGQQKLAVMRGEADADAIDLMKELFNIAPIAVEELERIMMDRSVKDSIRARVAFGLLDRAGYNPTQKIAVSRHVDDSVLEEAKRKALENGLANGTIVDATIIDEDEPDSRSGGTPDPNRAASSDSTDVREEVYRELSSQLNGAGERSSASHRPSGHGPEEHSSRNGEGDS